MVLLILGEAEGALFVFSWRLMDLDQLLGQWLHVFDVSRVLTLVVHEHVLWSALPSGTNHTNRIDLMACLTIFNDVGPVVIQVL